MLAAELSSPLQRSRRIEALVAGYAHAATAAAG